MLVGAESAEGELHRVGFAGDYSQLLTDRLHHRTFVFPRLRQGAWTAGEDGIARHADQILDRHRNALQHAEVDTGGEHGIGGHGLAANLVGIEGLVSVEGLAPAFVISDGPVGQRRCVQVAVTQADGDVFQRGGFDVHLLLS